MKKEAPAETILEILSAKPRLATAIDSNGYTALHIGLLARNADDLSQATEPSSLHMGPRKQPITETSFGDVDAILAVIKAYPKAAQMEDKEGRFPLHLAMFYRHSEKVVKALLQIYPRATRLKTNDSYTALHLGMWKNAPVESIKAVLLKYPEAASLKRLLLKKIYA